MPVTSPFQPLPSPYDPMTPVELWPSGPIPGAERVRVMVLAGYGINCESESAAAFTEVGAQADVYHVSDVLELGDAALEDIDIAVFPGGFSFGDHIGAGRVFANRVAGRLGDTFHRFVERGGLVLGICNGFQTIAKMGLLPALGSTPHQQATLEPNQRPGYYDGWVRLRFDPESPCVFTRGAPSWVLEVPSRHADGKMVLEPSVVDVVTQRHLVPVYYVDEHGVPTEMWPANPNGSEGGIAGLCDPTGRVFGLMPHPEAYLYPESHPDWIAQRDAGTLPARGLGLGLLANGVRAVLEG